MSVKQALADIGYSQVVVDEIDKLVTAVKLATVSFGYDVGSPSASPQGGETLGRTLKAYLIPYKDIPPRDLNTGQRRGILQALADVYQKTNTSYHLLIMYMRYKNHT